MSNPIKSIGKAVKKVFKKVVKVVKKVLPYVVAAAAIYYGGYALANGTLTGSGTHLSSMITGGGMGQGGSLFLPGANTQAASMLAGKGGVGQGWLGGSGFPGMGTKDGIAAINNTTALNTEITSNYAMTEPVNAEGYFTDLGATPTSTGAAIDPAARSTAAPADFGASNQVNPLAQQQQVYDPINTGGAGAPPEMLSDSQYTEHLTGVPTSGGTFQKDLAIQSGQNSNIFANAAGTNNTLVAPPPPPSASLTTPPPMAGNVATGSAQDRYYQMLLEDKLTERAAAPTTWYGKAWEGLGDYGKMAAVQTGGQMITGYAQGQAQEEEAARADQKEQDARNRLNAQRYGTYQYVPGVGIQYVPWNPAIA